MKKKVVVLKKLSLDKQVIAALDQVQQDQARGGANSIWEACAYTRALSCGAGCVTVAGLTCTPDNLCKGTLNAQSCISCRGDSGCPSQAPYCISQ
ncbi:class I lanthipeptide [Taibaiella chishuiensis]|uniref:Uncharacterized protein n=1 Tax=Taibaiella chishuiensis TaxID=1434707 RepID=A0A2P8CWZ0_9BACT|nr:class I lanthipeptide [Taibaiella chishuiensis]PSK89480.1 hypothetical protein B0I18_11134 [Taibaiella chishuiensis]